VEGKKVLRRRKGVAEAEIKRRGETEETGTKEKGLGGRGLKKRQKPRLEDNEEKNPPEGSGGDRGSQGAKREEQRSVSSGLRKNSKKPTQEEFGLRELWEGRGTLAVAARRNLSSRTTKVRGEHQLPPKTAGGWLELETGLI